MEEQKDESEQPEQVEEEIPTMVEPYRSARGKKAAKKIPGKQRRLERVQQRSMVLDELSQEDPEPMEEQKDESEQPERPKRPIYNLFSSKPDLKHTDSDESGKPFEIESLLDKRIEEGVIEYEVQWTGPLMASWLPAANISPEAIAQFEKNNAGKSKKAMQKRVGPRLRRSRWKSPRPMRPGRDLPPKQHRRHSRRDEPKKVSRLVFPCSPLPSRFIVRSSCTPKQICLLRYQFPP